MMSCKKTFQTDHLTSEAWEHERVLRPTTLQCSSGALVKGKGLDNKLLEREPTFTAGASHGLTNLNPARGRDDEAKLKGT